MPKARCLKCGIYGDVERHHPLPCRWFNGNGNNSWTEPLCRRCHQKADDITFGVEIDFGIDNRAGANYYRAEFEKRFVSFINSTPKN